MKISYNWLKQYLNINLPSERVSELLTDTGLEVEGLERIDTIKGGLRGVVIGEVLSCEKHPNADKLKITTVTIGGEEILPIVCGAPNVATGMKVLIATVGTEIYSDEDSFTIKKSKIRGEVSQGMICAEDELGLGESHDGIMALPADAKVGQAAAEFFNIESDYVFEIGLTPNRTDAMCHYGVARDLRAAILRYDGGTLDLILPTLSPLKNSSEDVQINIDIKNTEACYRYSGLALKNVKVKASPDWLQNKLRAIGLKTVNNIVDITNFVLHETGHPLHAFDAEKISGQQIIIKNADEGQAFQTLDGTELKLHAKDLMICDAEKPLVLAGVYGGLNSGVSSETKNVFLEAAYFDSVNVRKSAKRHGLNTDSSFRYERGVDPEMTLYALKRAASLIMELAGGELAMNIKDVHPHHIEASQVVLNLDRMNTLIGHEIEVGLVRSILQSLDIQITSESNQELNLEIPTYRIDVKREADVIEEVLRIYGFNAVPYDGPMRISVAKIDPKDDSREREVISNLLASLGFNEMMNNSLTKASYYSDFGFRDEDSIKMLNPLSQDLAVMRQSLVFGGLEATAYNSKRQRSEVALFEFGREYKLIGDKYQEREALAIWLSGKESPENWKKTRTESDFYTLKQSCLKVLERLGIGGLKEEALDSPICTEGISLMQGAKQIVSIGQVQSKLAKSLDVKAPVFYAHFDWSAIAKMAKRKKIVMKDLPKYPAVRRDLALLVDISTTYSSLRQASQKAGGGLLRDINLFDVYQGDNLPAGKKSYAISFVFRNDEKTLNDTAVDQAINKILNSLKKQFQAELR
jgi:phenylalanyl-tRNA synthetase beta chain